MLSRHLHSLALALVVSTLALILSGAAPVSGLVAVLVLLVAVAAPSRLSFGLALGFVLLGALAFAREPWAMVLNACLTHIFFAGTVALWVSTSARTPQLVDDSGTPSLRTLGYVVPAAVMLQIFLGAIFRHANAPVWPHIAGSMIVGCLLLYTGMVVLESHGSHPALKRVAQVLLGVTIAQIAFGLFAYMGRVMATPGTSPEWWTVAARAIHVATGAATLGAAVAYALAVFTHVRPQLHPIQKSVVA